MNLAKWAEITLQTTHYEIESELVVAFARANLRIDFVPIAVIYGSERSKINPLADTWRWFRWLWKRGG